MSDSSTSRSWMRSLLLNMCRNALWCLFGVGLMYLLSFVNLASWLPRRQPSEVEATRAEIGAVEAELRQQESQLEELLQRRNTLRKEQEEDRAKLKDSKATPTGRTSDVAAKGLAFFIAARDNE